MASINKVILIGHLGRDAEIKFRTGQDRRGMLSFTMATNNSYKNREGQWQTHTDWHRVVLWRDLADEMSERLKKGKQVFVEGRIANRSFDDKEGKKRYVSEVVATRLLFLGKNTTGDAAVGADDDAAGDDGAPAPF